MIHINPADAAARDRAERRRPRLPSGEMSAGNLTPDVRPARVFAKGVWRKNTYNGLTSNALVPDPD